MIKITNNGKEKQIAAGFGIASAPDYDFEDEAADEFTPSTYNLMTQFTFEVVVNRDHTLFPSYDIIFYPDGWKMTKGPSTFMGLAHMNLWRVDD